jgi:hypothetical protein
VTWNSTGFTESSLDGCTAGIGDNPVTTTVVADGYITIYTCRASTFVTYNTSLPSGGRRDPVVVNWSYGPGYEPGAATSTTSTSTSTSTSTTPSISDLQQQITSLIAQLNALILQAQAKGLIIPAGAQALVGTTSFTRDLEYGMTGEDVKLLQIYLNTHGYPVSTTGDGSLGHETTYFGPATQAALIKFQQTSNISPALGYFGLKTRTYITAHP